MLLVSAGMREDTKRAAGEVGDLVFQGKVPKEEPFQEMVPREGDETSGYLPDAVLSARISASPSFKE